MPELNSFRTTLPQPLAEVDAQVRRALAAEGFGVLTQIDVADVLAAKLGVQRPPLRILGACNPEIVHRALAADPSVSLLLPCNVVLEETPSGTRVSAADPTSVLAGPELTGVATDAAAALGRVFATLDQPVGP